MGNFRYCETLSFVFVVLMILFLLVDPLLSPLYSTHTIASRGVALKLWDSLALLLLIRSRLLHF